MGSRVLVVDDSPTIRKVVAAILTKNAYEPLSAADGACALEVLDKESVDLVLLDFVMPRMNGYQFCRAVRSRNDLRNLPIILMSAKAERIRDQFLRQTGALDAITKPFDARALIAVVEGALQRAADGRAPQAPDSAAMQGEETLQRTLESAPPTSGTLLAGQHEQRALLAATLAKVLAPHVSQDLSDIQLDAEKLEQSIGRALATAPLQELQSQLRSLALAGDPQNVLHGDIAAIPIGEILQVLQMQRQTGVLEVTNGKMAVFVSLRDGLVDLAQSRKGAPEFRLGRYFIDGGLISTEQLDQAVRDSLDNKTLLGDLLVQRGAVSSADLRGALIRQTSEMIYEVLRWKRGWFSLRRDVKDERAENAKLGLPVASIVMEGFRRVDEWRLIEESINFDEVLVRNEAAIDTVPGDELTTNERQLLDAIDGRRSVREIIEEAHQSSFDICKTFYRLLQSRLVRPKVAA